MATSCDLRWRMFNLVGKVNNGSEQLPRLVEKEREVTKSKRKFMCTNVWHAQVALLSLTSWEG
jgi:hypothetical protein